MLYPLSYGGIARSSGGRGRRIHHPEGYRTGGGSLGWPQPDRWPQTP